MDNIERKCSHCGELLKPLCNEDTGAMRKGALFEVSQDGYNPGQDHFYLFACPKCQKVDFVMVKA